MAFTESTVQAQLDAEGLNAKIVRFEVGASTTDIYCENINSVSRKTGWSQVANTLTAAQAATAIKASLSA